MALRRVDELPPAEPRYVAPDSHRAHGTHAKYVLEKCRCEPCTVANTDYNTRRNHAVARPDELWLPYVPAGRARRHLAELAAAGVGLKTVSKLSGLGHGVLSKLVYGDRARGMAPSKRIRPATEAKILAVTLETVVERADRHHVPAGPTWELLDDLIARGYPKAWLAKRITKNPNAEGLQIKRTWVYARTARRVAALHRLLGDRPGPGRKNPWDTVRRERGDQPWARST